jgi:hypothetical protein
MARIDRTTYLLARGWRRRGSFPGGDDQWYDTFDCKVPNGPYTAELAEEVQLARDVELRDYVEARRPRQVPVFEGDQ